MRTTSLIVLISVCALLLMISCGENKKKEQPAFYEPEKVESEQNEEQTTASTFTEPETTETSLSSGDVVEIPFIEHGGVKYIEAKLNNTIGVDMILDSGCSGATISITEAQYLYAKGAFSEEDYIGPTAATLANGNVEIGDLINLREIDLGGKIKCKNVKAQVIDNPQVPLLLGNDVLDRVSSYEVDNANKVIRFKIQ